MTTAAPAAVHAATQYALDVQSGAVVAGPWVRLAAARHLGDLARAGTDAFPYVFDEARADKVIRFFRFVRFYEGPRAGEPFTLEPFQVFKTAEIFGWVHRTTGVRRFTTAYIEEGKGNGKTPWAAVVGLYMLMADGEPGAQVYNAATKFDQAMLAFRAAHAFAEASPELAPRLTIDKTNIAHGKSNSFMRPIGNRVSGQSGPIPSCNLVDEIHEMKDPDVLNMLRRGTKSRRQALTIEITNAGEGQEGIAWEHHQKSIKVLQGVLEDEQWMAYICALDPEDQWVDESVWIKANPGLGTILPVEYVRRQVKEGLEILSAQNNVKRLNCCIWTATHTAWLDMEAFDRGRVERAEFGDLVAEATRAYGGVDLSETIAMTAYVEGWRLPAEAAKSIDEEEDTEAVRGLGRVAARAHFCLPEDGVLEREQRDGVPYKAWADQGYITLTPGNVVDYEFVRKRLEDSAKGGITQIGFDPWHARDLISRMEAGGSPVVEVPQSFTMLSDPCKQLERLIAAGWFLWEDNPVLRWHASNAVAKRDPNGNIKPDKSDPRAFIDGISALVTMLALMLRDPGDAEYDYTIDYLDL